MPKLPTDYTWNLGLLFGSDKDESLKLMQTLALKKAKQFAAKWSKNDKYLTDPLVLAQALKEYELFYRKWGTNTHETLYWGLRRAQDQADPNLKAAEDKAQKVAIEIANLLTFFELGLSKIEPKLQSKLLSHPQLKVYSYFLSTIFKLSKYYLTEKEEKILNLLSQSDFGKWVDMVQEFLSSSEKEVLDSAGHKSVKSFSDILSLTSDQNKKVRDTAARAVLEVLAQNIPVAEAEMNAILKTKQVVDDLRGYVRPDQDRLLSDSMDAKTVDTLLQSVESEYKLAHEFYQLKAKLFKVPKLAYHERNVEWGKIEGNYDVDKAKALILATFEQLDPEFLAITRHFIDEGHIDYFPRKGKSGGAFCSYHGVELPVYILLNHTGKLNDVLTFAHELGHGINGEMMKAHCDALTYGTPLATAEVASTFLEEFVLDRILEDADDEKRLAVLMMKLNSDISTIFRQIAFYRFEQELHTAFRKAGYLSKEQIGTIFKKHMVSYMGSAVSQDPGWENAWAYIGHFRSFFYVYSYASGLLISKAMQRKTRENKQFIEKVKEFLRSGSKASPRELFARMDIDITKEAFWKEGLREVESDIAEAKRLAKKLGKI
jgi:oligoendopeptidase F